jgi:transposase
MARQSAVTVELAEEERAELERWGRRRKTSQCERFLNRVDEAVRDRIEPGVEVHVVMDNYAAHKTARVERWFARRPRYHVHFTPTGASWLNQVERFFAEITHKRIRRGVFRSVQALEAAIRSYIADHNHHAQPFAWTADADNILRRVKNISMETSDSGH